MFTELMPLLAGRTVLITLARESDSTIRATIILSEKPGLLICLASPCHCRDYLHDDIS